jgi:hypothetical protein
MHFIGRNHSEVINDAAKKSDLQRSFLCPDLIDQLDPRNHMLGLAKAIPWQVF